MVSVDGIPVKPRINRPQVENLPAELKAIPQWVMWDYISQKEKWVKVPLQVIGKYASVSDPSTWTDFERAAGFLPYLSRGIAFVLRQGGGLVGVDLDGCRNPETGAISEPSASIIRRCNSYTEVSPSGKGIRIILRGSLPPGSRKAVHKCGLEIYEDGRYLTLTGNRLSKTSEIKESPNAIEWIVKLMREASDHSTQVESSMANVDLARSALAAIPTAYADGYTDWLEIGMALHAIDESLLADWDTWSQSSAKYDPGACTSKWASFKGNGIGPGTLFHHAKTCGWKPPRGFNRKGKKAGEKLTKGTLLENEQRTDTAAAERFAKEHGHQVKYIPAWNKWIVWDGQRWQFDTLGKLYLLAKQTSKRIWDEAYEAITEGPEEIGPVVLGYAKRMSSSNGIESMLKLAQSEPIIPVEHSDLDTHPLLLNVANGTIDLRTGKLRPADPYDLLTQSLSHITYDENADCPCWLKFLNSTFNNNRELTAFIQRLVGYFLTGQTTCSILPILWGSGANGKTVLTNTIHALLGEYAGTCQASLLLSKRQDQHPTELAALFRKRLITCSETNEGRRLDEAKIKSLTGGDKIQARRMREDFWEFEPTHKLMIATNHRPEVRGTDYAIWRRLLLIPFTQTFEGANRDENLTEKLRQELPGILVWAVLGAGNFLNDGLLPPEVVTASTKAYRDEQDTIEQWILECCDVGPYFKSKAKTLHDSYAKWIEDFRDDKLSKKAFGLKLKEKGFKSRSSNGIVYEGIQVSDNKSLEELGEYGRVEGWK